MQGKLVTIAAPKGLPEPYVPPDKPETITACTVGQVNVSVVIEPSNHHLVAVATRGLVSETRRISRKFTKECIMSGKCDSFILDMVKVVNDKYNATLNLPTSSLFKFN